MRNNGNRDEGVGMKKQWPLRLTWLYWRDMTRKPVKQREYRVRRSDGMYWAGPYRFQGVTFTNIDDMIYLFSSEESAEAAVKGSELEQRVRLHKLTVEEVW
jgi:hypothetical protein